MFPLLNHVKIKVYFFFLTCVKLNFILYFKYRVKLFFFTCEKEKKTNMITILMVYFRWVLLLLSHGGAAGFVFVVFQS